MSTQTKNFVQPIRGYGLPARAVYAIAGLVALGAAAMLYVLDPREPGNYPVCPFLGLTGYHCPGCGSLRAMYQLLHGSPLNALGYNPLTILSLPFLAYAFIVGGLRAFRAPAPAPLFIHPKLIWALFFGIAAFWVLRNVPIQPLSILAP